jgi:hypothetical protein
MKARSKRTGIRLILLAALSVWMLPAAVTGCTEATCESICLDQYEDCLARSPPGASKADCGAAYDSCLQSCSSSADAPEEEASP